MIENIAISMLLEMGILDALIAKQGETATAAELAAATGCNELVIGIYISAEGRIWRLSLHVVSSKTYACLLRATL